MSDDCRRPADLGAPVLQVRGLVKHYGATAALAGVDLDFHQGQVVGLVGANGAGKSTLIKILAGAVAPTRGDLLVDGRRVALDGPTAAQAAGIATVHQDVDAALVGTMTVAENLVLADLATGSLRSATPKAVRAAAAALVGEDFPIDLRRVVAGLSTSDKQQILIARALARRPRVLVLDEPTAALSVREIERLLTDVRALATAGTTVIFISHHLREVIDVSDRVVALRDGVVAADLRAPVEEAVVVQAILGQLAGRRSAASDPAPATGEGALLRATGLRARAAAPEIDLEVRRGEVLGITGLLGAGKTELLEQLVGARPLLAGRLSLDGEDYRPGHPGDAVAVGVGFVTEDRVRAAEIPGWDISRTVSLPDLRRLRRGPFLDRGAERSAARSVIDRLAVVCSSETAAMSSLSGGNRQKVVVGRWIAAGARLLVLDEPFRGVDLQARADIASLLRSGEVEAAVVAASDPEEVLEVADRVLVMAGGAIVGEFRPDELDADQLSVLLAGGEATVPAPQSMSEGGSR